MVHKVGFVVAVKCNGKILREIFNENGESIVKLPFSSEYQILLKNLETRSALVKISIDGIDVSDSSIIVTPNSTTPLEGFLKDFHVTNKFKFIEKTEQISNFRGDRIDDGIVRVQYTFEAFKPQVINDHHYHHHYHDWNYYYWPWWPSPYISYGPSGSYVQAQSSGSPGDVTFTCSNNLQNKNIEQVNCFNSNVDGITVPGSKSEQMFYPANVETLETNSHVIIIRLQGSKDGKKVEKAVHTKTKLMCPTCGRRSKSDAQFCRNCGTALF